jgi:hypothetical protein
VGEKFGGWSGWPTVVVWTAVCAVWLIVIWTWSALHLAMTVDDTYYYFKTALNVGRGVGSSFDGINPTDGYHPLWLAMLALLFKPLPDDMILLTRVAFTLQIAMVWGGGLLLARLRDAGGARILWPLGLVLVNPFAAKIVLCGQETALQFVLSCAALAMWWALRDSPRDSLRGWRPLEWAGLALVCAIATLARLDTAFFCGALLAMPLVLPSDDERKAGLAARIKRTALGLAVYGGLIGAFLVYRLIVFHHLVPVSGAIKEHLDDDEVAPLAARLAVIALALAAMAAFWLAARRSRSRVLALLAPPVAGALVVAIYNFGVRGEMSPSLIRIWYLEPFLVVAVIVIGALLAVPGRRLPMAVFGAAAGLWLGLTALSWRYRLETRSYALYLAAERSSRWVERHAEVGAIGAAWDAGFAAAFTRKPVMNLDGLISSWEYKERYLDPGKVDEFILARQPVDFVIQYAWQGTIRGIARRFEREPLSSAPRLQATVTGARDASSLSGRWGVDLSSFSVAHVECITVSVAYDPTRIRDAAYYFVLTRARMPGRATLAEFAVANRARTSCDGFQYVD